MLVSYAIRYRQEVSALIWHARHGSHAEINGIKVQVPLLYEAEDSDGVTSLVLTKFGGTLQPGGGFIMVSFLPHPSSEAQQRVDALMTKRAVTKTKVEERTVVFAGRSGSCIESISKTGNQVVDEIFRTHDLCNIDCRFGDVTVKFGGSANLKDDLYRMIQSAQQVGWKN